MGCKFGKMGASDPLSDSVQHVALDEGLNAGDEEAKGAPAALLSTGGMGAGAGNGAGNGAAGADHADLPEGWKAAVSRSRPGKLAFVNLHTGERISWVPTEPAPLEKGQIKRKKKKRKKKKKARAASEEAENAGLVDTRV